MAKNKEPRNGLQTVRGAKQKTRQHQYISPPTDGQGPSPAVDLLPTSHSAANQRARILRYLQEIGPITTLSLKN